MQAHEMKNGRPIRTSSSGIIMTLIATILWGLAFVAQQSGMDNIGPFTFSVCRGYVSAVLLFITALILRKTGFAKSSTDKSMTIKGGIILGIALFFGANLQQMGLAYTTVAKAGFITTMYVAFVPFVGILFRNKLRIMDIVCAAVALIGLYFLSMNTDLSMSKGDLMELGCAFFFSIHILLIDRFAPKADVLLMNGIQFFVFATLSIIPMALTEAPTTEGIFSAMIPILYTGVMSGCVAYSLQIFAQQRVEPALSSLLMCFESVFAALFGWILLKQSLSGRELLGCILVFLATILSQVYAARVNYSLSRSRIL